MSTRPLLFLLSLMLLVSACGTKLHTILERNPGFTFRVPDGFSTHPDEPINGDRTSWIAGDDATIRLILHRISPKQKSFTKTAAVYGEFFLKAMKKDPSLSEIKVISHAPLRLGEKDAYEVIFSATTSHEGARWRRRVFARHPYREDRFVELMMSADLSRETKYQPNFESLIGSWQWVEVDGKKEGKKTE